LSTRYKKPRRSRDLRVLVERPEERVEQHEALDTSGERERQRDRRTEVVSDEREALEAERVGERGEPARMRGNAIVGAGRTVGQPEPEVVGREAAVCRREPRDERPPIDAPGRRPVREQDRRAAPHVDVAHPPVGERERARLEGIERAVEPGGRRVVVVVGVVVHAGLAKLT
jgi:hypothetical protein